MKCFACLYFVCFCVSASLSQPEIEWQRSLGGSNDDVFYSIEPTNDGGFILAGFSYSNDGDLPSDNESGNCWIVKLNSNGEILWQKLLGGSDFEEARSIKATNDGGFIVAGISHSNDGDVSGNHGSGDIWIVKLNNVGEIQWQKSIGGSKHEEPWSIRQTSDEGYIVAGYSYSNDGDVSNNHGYKDYWIVKLTYEGEIQWQKSLGGTGNDLARSIQQTNDGGYIIAGYSNTQNNGNVTGNHGIVTGFEGWDCWVVKIDSTGTISWQKSLGGTYDDFATSIQQVHDTGYILAGASYSEDGDVSGNHGNLDFWVAKLDSQGTAEWQKSLGGTHYEEIRNVDLTDDNGYILAGYTESKNGDVTGHHGSADYWIVKLNSVGSIQWEKCLGGSHLEKPWGILQAVDGGYVAAGFTHSNDGDIIGNHGAPDGWIVKLSSFTSIMDSFLDSNWQIYPNPTFNSINVQFSEDIQSAMVGITDLIGMKQIIQNINRETSIDISHLPSGIYILTLQTPNGKFSQKKFVKQ